MRGWCACKGNTLFLFLGFVYVTDIVDDHCDDLTRLLLSPSLTLCIGFTQVMDCVVYTYFCILPWMSIEVYK